METMRDIKIRLKSIDSTRQITESMRLISTRKVQKMKIRREENRPYLEQTTAIIDSIINDPQLSPDIKEHPYIAGYAAKAANTGTDTDTGMGAEAEKKPRKPLVIVITGDRGLCGGYNSNVQKEASALIRKIGDSQIIAIGTKGRDYFRRRRRTIVRAYKGMSENPFYEDAQTIAETALKMFNETAANEVYLVYTVYKTMLTQNPKAIRLLPLDRSKTTANTNITKTETASETEAGAEDITAASVYDSGEEKFFKYAVSSYVASAIFGAMLESAVCEQCARLTGMDSAVKNSKKIIDALTLQYNQMRQSAITQEIAEIVGGANAVGDN